ncbi:26S proteasome non-ATPase regulatory subunit 6-like [Oscarella lobularis]|uniref:26S proteasome non-ATPase regulatory subunit 6-like n=1 Tax=Oscarella lobularis TaxID=121494 RepID=UPI003313FF8D
MRVEGKMSGESLEEQGLPKVPDLELARLYFQATCLAFSAEERDQARKIVMETVREKNYAPFYELICSEWKIDADETLLSAMKAENKSQLEKLDEAIRDAEENLGETEVRDALIAKAEYFCNIGAKDDAISALRVVYEKTASVGSRLDLVFYQLRLGLFFMDDDLITRNIDKAKGLVEEGGDWDRRNRLKVYEAIHAMSVRNFKQAASNFLDAVSTFTSYELMDYKTMILYTVLCCMISLERVELKTKVVQGSEVQEILHQLPVAKSFLSSLYECKYGVFFRALGEVEGILKRDRYLCAHSAYYVREMRVLAYTQLLESYRSLTLQYMANAFDVSIEFIDRELSRFIAARRLNCKIDKVNGVVETNRPDQKNWQYQAVIKHGDALLNRLQKLSRVINI